MESYILRTPVNTSTVSVTTAILRVFGASSWTSTVATRYNRCGVSLYNASTTDPVYVKLIVKDASLTSVVSATTADRKILPGETVFFKVGKDIDLAVIRPVGSTANVTATEFM